MECISRHAAQLDTWATPDSLKAEWTANIADLLVLARLAWLFHVQELHVVQSRLFEWTSATYLMELDGLARVCALGKDILP